MPYQAHIQIAVALSLLLHAVAFGAYRARETVVRRWWHQATVRRAAVTPPSPARETVVPTITFIEQPRGAKPDPRPQRFIETDPRQASAERPEPTPFYSDKSTIAANPENPSEVEGETPYLEGEQTKVLSTENVPLPSPGAMALSQERLAATRQAAEGGTPPAPGQPAESLAAEGLKQVTPGESGPKQLASASRPGQMGPAGEPEPPPDPGATGLSFPDRDIAARKVKLTAAGVSRTGIAAFNVAENPFGEYDKRLIRTVQQRWFALIGRYGVYERAGTVTLYFQLYDDGSVRNLQRKENSAGEILALYCEKAITDAAPFEPLTTELRRLVGGEPREVNFTFYY